MGNLKAELKRLLDEMFKAALDGDREKYLGKNEVFTVKRVEFLKAHGMSTEEEVLEKAGNAIVAILQYKNIYGEESKQCENAKRLAPGLIDVAKKFIDNPK